MQYLKLENVSKSYGEKVLFSDISFSISKGDKIALVAQNGTGKTTLLRVIAGEEGIEGENSSILFSKDLRISYLKQDPYFNPEDNVLDAILRSDSPALNAVKKYEHALIHEDNEAMKEAMSRIEDLKAWDIESRVKEVLGKLKIHNLDQKVNTLSGGQVKRLALAQIMIDEPDFLILDEPTNHLDLEMIEWLEKFLQRSQLTLFMVTHDRYFLERICNEIIELDQGNLYYYDGNYSAYLEKKSIRKQNEAINLEKTKKLFRKELDWIRRQPKARTTKAKSRVQKFDVIKEKAHKKVQDEVLEFIIQSQRLGSKICELHNVGMAFDEIKLIEDFTYKFKKNERVGIVGPNGAGKSTFLKIITQALKPTSGRVVIGETVVFGHYTQMGLNLQKDKRVIDVIRDIAEYIPLEKGFKLTAESLLEKFLFPRSQHRVYVSQLSGGERRRLHLLTVLMKNPNFLILDEPTNDLDILTLNILEDYLKSFKGVLVIVTHDRYFMDKLVDHLFILTGNGKVKDYNGTYTEFRSEYSWTNLKSQTQGQSQSQIETNQIEETKPEKKSASYSEKMEFQKLEKEIEKLESRKKEINEKFLDTSLDVYTISSLSIELGEIQTRLSECEDRWLELADIVMN
ncbi:MAG: ABC-F family ATP-binding cassette domain-containing protein [Saprospiraceae bacterium]|nr:ABC-F family ATP-binding cassette domain-containing protein [Saprospiraceae bacterium]